MNEMEAIVAVFVAIVAAVPATIGAIAAVRGAKHSRQTNDAVNNIHGSERKRLYDVVLDISNKIDRIHDWKSTYDASPWYDGNGVREWLNSYYENNNNIKKNLESINQKIDDISNDK